jgi:hypothetical protein
MIWNAVARRSLNPNPGMRPSCPGQIDGDDYDLHR